MTSSAFQRSPSKVWWAQGLEENVHHAEWNRRTGTGSPSSHKSQDSGFSDSEASPTLATEVNKLNQKPNSQDTICEGQNEETPKRMFSKDILSADILKDISYITDMTPKKNFKENIKEKYSPKKSVSTQLNDECLKKSSSSRLYEKRNACCRSAPSTPANQHRKFKCTSKSTSEAPSPNRSPNLARQDRLTLYNPNLNERTPNRNDFNYHDTHLITSTPNSIDSRSVSRKLKPGKYSPRVSRNLLSCFPKEPIVSKSSEELLDEQDFKIHHSKSLPYLQPSTRRHFNATVPLHYDYQFRENHIEAEENVSVDSDKNDHNSDDSTHDDSSNEVISSDSFSFQNEEMSDCEKEVRSFFLDKLDPPTHSSTPKIIHKNTTATKVPKVKRTENHTVQTVNEGNPKLVPQVPSVRCWLNEVEQLYEPECMTTLQSKSIAMDLACHVSRLAENITTPIRDMMRQSRIITKEFNQLKMYVINKSCDHLAPLTQSLVGNITEFVLKYIVHSQSSSLTNTEQRELGVHKLLEIVKQLRKSTTATSLSLEDIALLISNLQDVYYTAEHNILALQIQLLVNAIEESESHIALRAVLSGITFLALQCERLSDLVVQSGGPRVLLILCVGCKASTIRTMALRALATVCCSTTAIRQLEQADGIEVLADILNDRNRPEPELSEATAVLAQITAPWIEDNHTVQGLAKNVGILIDAITDFLEKTKCCQNLLLCAAALANLTYMNLNCIGPLMQHQTLGKLLTAVRNRGPKASVFLKEQTATLIANLSDIPESRSYIADNNAAVALLCFLQVNPIHPQDDAHCSAAQRLQQKSAIALSRLCNDVNVAKQIVELGGVTRLTQLCKEGRERNYSDAVLVACLATLRKIVANCGNEIMDQQDIMELVEPRLLDSFLAYSSQNESYV